MQFPYSTFQTNSSVRSMISPVVGRPISEIIKVEAGKPQSACVVAGTAKVPDERTATLFTASKLPDMGPTATRIWQLGETPGPAIRTSPKYRRCQSYRSTGQELLYRHR